MPDEAFKYPSISSLYTNRPQGGKLIEGVGNREGISGMQIAAYTQQWSISNITWSTRPEPALQGREVKQLSYIINVKTFTPLDTLGEIKRYETVSSWQLREQEINRHHFKILGFMATPLWKAMTSLVESEFQNIAAAINAYLQEILARGDFSLEHFAYYVKQHERSSSPWGIKWKQILENETQLKHIWENTNRFIKEYIQNYLKMLKPGQVLMIKAEHLYPGMRARPADYQVLRESDHERTILCSKWRDRKVGGVMGLSQLTYPIYEHPSKKFALQHIQDYIAKLTGINTTSLTLSGPSVYKDVLTKKLKPYDMPIAEAVTGEILKWFGFAADLSDPADPAEVAAELYSGVGPTGEMNELCQAIGFRGMLDLYGVKPNTWDRFSDNAAIDIELPPECFFLDKADTFCGLLTQEGRFGPVSLCTDNIKHRIPLKGNQTQVQYYQYIMRPLLAVITNAVNPSAPNDCLEYIDFMVENTKNANIEDYRKDTMHEWLMENVKLHEPFIKKFPKSEDYVKHWFNVRYTNPETPTDLRII